MRKFMRTSATDSLNPAERLPNTTERRKTWGAGSRRAMLAGVAMMPLLSLPAVAEDNVDDGLVNLARRLLAAMDAECSLRLALEAAWAASEGVRHQLLTANPHLRFCASPVHELLQRTEPGRRHAIAYGQWNKAWRECCTVSEMIVTETPHTGRGLAAHVIAYFHLHRAEFNKPNGGPLLRAAVAMLAEELPAYPKT
jgi:hypothetical protein